ncbi:MAG TPA: methylenetetrahydrofolate reductase, partial [Bacteroidia bacterium]|nr:methylenetetrahydrofolate reductase [Bacteroidia bacterium]
ICGGFTKEETENALIDLQFLGIDNVLLLRGDAVKTQGEFKAEIGGHRYALDLVKQVVNLNKGKYLDDELQDVEATDFCIGVAGYPEKHFEAPNLNTDILYLKKKVDAGAEYIVTQMFFDNKKYFEFVERCRKEGINVPIIPGLKPITRKAQVSALPKTFFIDIPDDLFQSISRCKNEDDVKQVGIEWGIQQSKELLNAGVPVLHYYTMSNSEPVLQIARSVF